MGHRKHKKHSELLRAAAPVMFKGWSNPLAGPLGLCNALQQASSTPAEARKVVEIQKRISKLIWPYVWAEGWLRHAVGVPAEELESPQGLPTIKMQEWRRAWAEHLAKEYEAKGE